MSCHAASAPRVLALLILATVASTPASGGWGGSATATTDYVVRGISESNGDPVLQLDLHHGWPAGWYAGGFATSLGGNQGDYPAAQYNAYAGRAWALGTATSATLAVGRYWYGGGSGAGDYDYDELTAALTWRELLTGAVTWFPDRKAYAAGRADPDRGALSCELSARFPLARHVGVTASGGYYDVHGLQTSGYWFGSAGIEGEVRGLVLAVAWFGTDSGADDLYDDDAAGQRWAATASWRF